MTRDSARLAEAKLARMQQQRYRNDLHDHIRRAHKDGWSLREIATAVGLSPSRVYQITQEQSS